MAKMFTNETFKFIELYQAENCLWNPKNKNYKHKNVLNEAWERISKTMDIPVHELKKKKDNLLTTFRINLKKRKTSDFEPTWIYYDALAEFLTDVYENRILQNSEEMTQYEDDSNSNTEDNDNLLIVKNEVDVDTEIPDTPKKKLITQTYKRPAKDPLELQESIKKMNTSSSPVNNELINKKDVADEDECELFCRMLAKQLKEYPRLEREEIMSELHGVMLNRRRLYNAMQGGQ